MCSFVKFAGFIFKVEFFNIIFSYLRHDFSSFKVFSPRNFDTPQTIPAKFGP